VGKATRKVDLRGDAFRDGAPEERTPLRDNLEWIALAVLMVLLVRQVVVEAFRIRHGSMAPTLVGTHQEVRCPNCGCVFHVGRGKVAPNGEVECPNCRYHWDGAARYDPMHGPLMLRQPEWLWNEGHAADGAVFDGTDGANRVYRGASRIFVNKFIYRLRKPRRWEVVVFLYPMYSVRCKTCDWQGETASLEGFRCPDCGDTEFEVASRNFIKRVVGLPGETISLKDGDAYADGQILRKPAHVQDGLWMHVFDSRFMPKVERPRLFDVSEAPSRWQRVEEGGVLTVNALRSAEPVMAAFGRPILDIYPYDGLSYDVAPGALSVAGRNTVGDCRIRARVRVLEEDSDGGEIVLEIQDGGHTFTISVPTRSGRLVTLREDDGVVREEAGDGLSSGWVTLENYDDRIVGKIGGREVFRYDYQSSEGSQRAVRFGAQGARVLWERVHIQRDVYYTQPEELVRPRDEYRLAGDEYFVMGDNSPASSDSRRWQHPGVPESYLIGKAFFVFWPVHQVKWL